MSDTDNLTDKSCADVRGYKAYAALKYVPPVLCAVFAILAFAAFAMPLAYYGSANSGIAVGAPGNIYSALGDLFEVDEHVRNTVVAFYIAAAVAAAYAIFAIITCVRGSFGRRNSEDYVGATFAGNVDSGCYAVYILFVVLSVVMLYRISVIDEGNGVISVGASTPVMLACALAFAFISIVCMIVRRNMENKNGALREAEQRKHENRTRSGSHGE